MKKNFKQFLDEVIVPIENTNVDHGNLFFLFQSFPKFDLKVDKKYYSHASFEESEDFENYFGYSVNFKFSVPEDNRPGSWQLAAQNEGVNRKEVFKLVNLYGILLNYRRGGQLFLAEGGGEIRRLGFDDFFYISLSPENLDAYQQVKLDTEKKWYETMNLGLGTSEARLLRRINNFTPYLLWQFSINSIERQISLRKRNNLFIPDAYEKALMFASVNSKYVCGMDNSQLEEIIGSAANEEDFEYFYAKLLVDIKEEIDKTINIDIPSKFIGKAIANVINMPTYPFDSTKELTAQHLWQFRNLYKEEYDLPVFSKLMNSDNVEDNMIFHRISFAATKQELNWQVAHLQELLGF